MLLWLYNLGFAGGGSHTSVSFTGPYKRVAAVSAVGKTQWVDYLPVTYVAPSAALVGTWDDAGALAVVTVAASGVAWTDYIPIVEVTATYKQRYEDTGYLPVVEVV